MLLAVCHSARAGWGEVENLEDLSDLRGKEGNLLWAEADVAQLSPADLDTIAQEFELHPLAVEDAVHTRQRPKLEAYDTHLFAVLHELVEQDGQLEAIQIACFIGQRYVLTIHAGAERTLTEAKRRWARIPTDHQHPSFLLHTVIDVVVDDYQTIADRLEQEMEGLEEIILATPAAPIQRQLYELKQRLARLRRYVLPGSRVLDWIVDPDTKKPFSDETAALFRDVHDHMTRIGEQVRNVDELTQAILDLTRAEHAEALNETSKKLSAWAAIFAVGTLIAGIYGMNFELIPNEQSLFGFLFAIGLTVLCSLVLYINFKKRDWL
ncbi:MAG TPA: CorA family divalent cation transporter [Actinomycetota bacterium]|nr:CorA family divalent cation transporter [Actinomycetota bacterium]